MPRLSATDKLHRASLVAISKCSSLISETSSNFSSTTSMYSWPAASAACCCSMSASTCPRMAYLAAAHRQHISVMSAPVNFSIDSGEKAEEGDDEDRRGGACSHARVWERS